MFLNAVKNNTQYHKIVLTGIMRMDADWLSDINNIAIYDFQKSKYAELIGFTQKEVDKTIVDCFPYYNECQ